MQPASTLYHWTINDCHMRVFFLLLMVATSVALALQEPAETPKRPVQSPRVEIVAPPSSRNSLIDCIRGVACPMVPPGWWVADLPEGSIISGDGVNPKAGFKAKP